jgi:hypothetical protein
LRVSVIGEPRTVLIADDRMWWVPLLGQVFERLEAAIVRQWPAWTVGEVREHVALQLARRFGGESQRSWEEIALELLVEVEATRPRSVDVARAGHDEMVNRLRRDLKKPGENDL